METHTEKHPTQKDLWKRWDQNPPAQKTHCRLRDKRDRIFLGPPFEDDRGNCWSQPGLGLAVTNQSMNSLCRIDSRLTLNPQRPAALWAGHCEQIVGLDSTIVPGKRETTGSTNVEHVWQWIAKLGMVHISNPLNWDVRIHELTQFLDWHSANKQFPHSCPDGNFAVAASSSVVLRAYTACCGNAPGKCCYTVTGLYRLDPGRDIPGFEDGRCWPQATGHQDMMFFSQRQS